MKYDLTQKELKELFTYNDKSGLFTWNSTGKGRKKDKVAGSILNNGYLQIQINGYFYKAHVIAWFYYYGYWAKSIDHVNHERADNRINNLRDVDGPKENGKNISKPNNNTSGVVGVYWQKNRCRWNSSIKVDQKQIHLGSFVEFSDAVNARKNAEILYGFHKNHGT